MLNVEDFRVFIAPGVVVERSTLVSSDVPDDVGDDEGSSVASVPEHAAISTETTRPERPNRTVGANSFAQFTAKVNRLLIGRWLNAAMAADRLPPCAAGTDARIRKRDRPGLLRDWAQGQGSAQPFRPDYWPAPPFDRTLRYRLSG